MPRSIVDRRDSRGAATRSSSPPSRRAPTPATLVLLLQGAIGNAAVARMVAPRRTLARTLAEKVSFAALGQGQVTLAKLREVKAKLESAWRDLSADQVQASYVEDTQRVNDWFRALDTRLQALVQEINQGAPPDPEQVGMTMDLIQAQGTPLANRFRDVVVTSSNIRGAINKAWDDWDRDRQERQAKAAEEAESAYKPVKEAQDKLKEEKEKEYKRKEGKALLGTTEGADEDEELPVGFPHKGKHAPRKRWIGQDVKVAPADWPTKVLELNTAAKGATAAYKTQDVPRVLAWENEARTNGLTLYGTTEALAKREGFTIVYGFTEDVGADHGEMTRFVRIDGDHGHPIVESYQSLKTSFTAYIKKEIEAAKEAKDNARLKQIWDFLNRLKLRPGSFGLKSEPKVEPVKQ